MQFPKGYYNGYRASGAGSVECNQDYLFQDSSHWNGVNGDLLIYRPGGPFGFWIQDNLAENEYYDTGGSTSGIINNWGVDGWSGIDPPPTFVVDGWYAVGADIAQVNGLYLPVAGGYENSGNPGYYIGSDATPEPAFLQGSPDFKGTPLYTGVQGLNDYSSLFMTWTPVNPGTAPTVYPLVYIKPASVGRYVPRYRYRRR